MIAPLDRARRVVLGTRLQQLEQFPERIRAEITKEFLEILW